ncbi:cytochrome-c peroxidase [Croceivirga sp. JEA036]|uniref:cytochrome-c peroxidase n=1 Tax=Croceivirga sp. JEA036 TaxID=2721162 RepID=UPI00143BA60A|nr:cytochrome c peroxidase [Croceivirga sp. JEA036]NJB35531.1 methylamine utilization protein [Croceivirga sp. JEA036]
MKYHFRTITKGVYACISLFAIVSTSCKNTSKDQEITNVKQPFNLRIAQIYKDDLLRCAAYVDSIQHTENTKDLERYYLEARSLFKAVEPILAFQDVSNYTFLNAPNILKIEEEDLTNIRINDPKSFQTLEESIYANELDIQTIHGAANLITQRLKLLEKNTDLSYLKDHHILWMLRDALLRVALTGITGYDSPVLEASLSESATVYQTLKDVLMAAQTKFQDKTLYEAWLTEINQTIQVLNEGEFVSFDRFDFIKNHTNKQLTLFNKTVVDWEVKFPFTMAINNDATSVFSNTTFNTKHFTDLKNPKTGDAVLQLGQLLFNDPNLSKKGNMRCATCHHKDKAFTDGLKVSKGQKRNAPTLTYAALQQKFFYDTRAGSLEGQIVAVVTNQTEFHADLDFLLEKVKQNKVYKPLFDSIYNGKVTDFTIRNAMAEYIRSLSPFNSKFDNNINGLENTITESEKLGFNIFMGKGKCATCHFPPVFNGTIPPAYNETEVELLGVPAKNDTINAVVDADLGGFHLFGTEERKYFFKTPTVRNAALTAPYMHNGVYPELAEVVDFYNRGGGAGIGINLPLQTLPPDPLQLSIKEQQALVDFMESLTDSNL